MEQLIEFLMRYPLWVLDAVIWALYVLILECLVLLGVLLWRLT